MAPHATAYRWSSAGAHLGGPDEFSVLDLRWWREQPQARDWADTLHADDEEAAAWLRRCTYSGRPFGDKDFVDDLSRRFGRYWQRGRPKKDRGVTATVLTGQLSLLED